MGGKTWISGSDGRTLAPGLGLGVKTQADRTSNPIPPAGSFPVIQHRDGHFANEIRNSELFGLSWTWPYAHRPFEQQPARCHGSRPLPVMTKHGKRWRSRHLTAGALRPA